MLKPDHLTALLDILKTLHTLTEPQHLWKYVLERSCRTVGAGGGSFFTVTEDKRMELAAAVGVDEERLRRVPLRVGVGLCGWVAEHQEPVVLQDVRSDPRFNPIADQITGSSTQSLLCVPIFSANQTYGVIELVNGPFEPEAQEFVGVLGQQTAVAYQNLLLTHETHHTKVLLESLLTNMSGGVIAIDRDSNVIILNPAARQLLKLGDGFHLGKPVAALLMEYPSLLEPIHRALSKQSTVSRHETSALIGGAKTRIGYSSILISDPQQRLLGSAIIFQKLE